MHILLLANDTIYEIFQYLNYNEIRYIKYTCSRFYKINTKLIYNLINERKMIDAQIVDHSNNININISLVSNILLMKPGYLNFLPRIDENISLHTVQLGKNIRDLTGYTFPRTVYQLIFNPQFNSTIFDVNFPINLRILKFGNDFNQSLNNIKFPETLKRIEFGNDYRKSLCGTIFPENLEELIINNYICIVKSDFSIKLPNSLKILCIGKCIQRSNKNHGCSYCSCSIFSPKIYEDLSNLKVLQLGYDIKKLHNMRITESLLYRCCDIFII